MLDVANKYEGALRELFMNIWYDERYKYYSMTYSSVYKASENNDCDHQFVSKSKNNKILGYIRYDINRYNEHVTNVTAVNFSNDKLTFGRDLITVLTDIFDKYNFRKVSFFIVVGNPIEQSYDKLIKKFGGRIVGILKQDCKLIDNKYYDVKLYEILRSDYRKIKQA